ncbi:Phosphoglycerol transferase MdoB [Halobacillus karajensis]|uniref:Lipoteichoic acid synthase 1 n=1 Tax=Halobacillus karajensis TaxID=195088 RepID=A0A024P7L5_9BACI|nr:LTA synthase family protein [Halobacillus karajensis]CDQ17993.1 Lipoteichoic acid synthase 1 [Halobacillus karajensis]CDQ24342.1 Lipoteichoic acid synthase 1 [Halobacillus karajensis]CDQ29409.1 Lipoteichoic acid synthase 1 [Halobacillus karajensis]SEH61317.1 Phosphoglycerol transferase MdoB [Halobacillus karajensis]
MQWRMKNVPLFIIATLLFGLKTYVVYRFMFDLSIENPMQEFILFFNPIASAYLIFAISVWMKPKNQMKYLRWTVLLGSLILFLNLVFYRNFTDFITIPVLFQGNNAADLTSSFLTLVHIEDLFIFADVALVWYLSKQKFDLSVKLPKRGKIAATAVTFLLLAGNVVLAEIERPMLFVRAFDREYLVKNIGVYNYHLYDATMQTKTKAQRVFADGSEVSEIESYLKETSPDKPDKNGELYGIAEDKNVIFVSVESFQNFLLDSEVNGTETTPFLNELKESKDTITFENFYHQTAQGKTSDSEFIVENSLYPLGRGAVYFTHAANEYNALPEILNEEGYETSVFHANNASFWNRDVMYDNIGYDEFYDEKSYEVTPENSFGWGLEDKAFFEQSIKYLQSQEKPFYSKFITLTHHFPFELPEEKAHIDKYDSNSKTLNSYFQTARYTDEALEQFFQQLKDAGLYEDSIIILMGDHYGISDFHNKAMGQFLGKEVDPYVQTQLQRVPFMVHIPGYEKGGVRDKVVGQIDVKPTLLHLLGIEESGDMTFGDNMFAKKKKDFVALRDGSFVSEEYVYTNEVCYDRSTGEPLSEAEAEACQPIKEKVTQELSYSDNIIYGDLFRFYDFDKEEE